MVSSRQTCGAIRGSCDLPAMCLIATGLQFFKICHSAELNKIVGATMPMDLYNSCMVLLRKLHGKGDLESYGHSKLIKR